MKMTNGAEKKKEILYKICMALFIAVFMVALYLNNERIIDNVTSAKKVGAAVDEAANATAASEDVLVSDNAMVNDIQAEGADFILYGNEGVQKHFSDYRGNIAIVVFWTPGISESLQQLGTVIETLNTLDLSDVSLISVCVPDKYVNAGENIGDGTAALPAGDNGSDGTAALPTGGFDAYTDAEADLARLFLLSEYPTTYIFKTSGAMSDYQKGYIGAARIERMLSRAR